MIILKDLRIAYPALFVARGFEGSDPKFSATFLMDEDSDAHKKLKSEIKKVAENAFGENWKKIIQKQDSTLRRLIKVGNEKENQDGEIPNGFEDKLYFKASNKKRIKVVDRNREPLEETDGKPYGGCYVNAQIDVYAQDNKFGKFINLTLLAVQFSKDGDAFGGVSQADVEAFDVINDDEDESDF